MTLTISSSDAIGGDQWTVLPVTFMVFVGLLAGRAMIRRGPMGRYRIYPGTPKPQFNDHGGMRPKKASRQTLAILAFLFVCASTSLMMGINMLKGYRLIGSNRISPVRDDSSMSVKADATTPLERPRLGRPFSWDELVEIIPDSSSVTKDYSKLDILYRSDEVERRYVFHRKEVQANWVTIYDHILWSKFKDSFQRLRNEDGKWYVYPKLEDVTTVQTVLVPNEFPYFVEEGIKHYVLWKIAEEIRNADMEAARLQLQKSLGASEILHWINPPHLRSLPGIHHVQFLFRIDDHRVDD